MRCWTPASRRTRAAAWPAKPTPRCNMVVVGGEITTKAKLDFNDIAREAIREIGYVNDDDVFHADKVFITNLVTRQSPDIAQGVDAQGRRRQGHRRAGRGRPGFDVRLRLQRDARIDAGADHVRPPSRPRTDPHPQSRRSHGSGPMPRPRFPSNTKTASRCASPTSSFPRSTPRT